MLINKRFGFVSRNLKLINQMDNGYNENLKHIRIFLYIDTSSLMCFKFKIIFLCFNTKEDFVSRNIC